MCSWSEKHALFSYDDRFALVAAGVRDLTNVTLHAGSDYIISRATFPGYFLKEKALIDQSWTAIDLLLFREYIAPALGITHRFVGTEPFDAVTRAYNADMQQWLHGAASAAPSITVVEIERLSINGAPVSASRVRSLWTKQNSRASRHSCRQPPGSSCRAEIRR